MACPQCKKGHLDVQRTISENKFVIRYLKCDNCDHRLKTVEEMR